MWTSFSHRQPFQNQGLMASRNWMIKCIIAQFVFTGKQRNVPTQLRWLILKKLKNILIEGTLEQNISYPVLTTIRIFYGNYASLLVGTGRDGYE